MTTFKVIGGNQLKGEVFPQGSKNEALQVISATLLTSNSVRINNIPNIKDVNKLISIIKNLGVKCKKNSISDYTFCFKNLDLKFLKTKKFFHDFSKIRGSIMILGPLLGRFNIDISIPFPSGDKIGKRRLDTHVKSLILLGISFFYDKKKLCYTFKSKQSTLRGCYILMEEISVTGTANIIMATVLIKGKTIIYNAACEPYIQQLCKMLKNMGAKIYGIGSNLLTIIGVHKLTGCLHNVLPDIIEIGSWISVGATTCSEIIIKNVFWEDLGVIPTIFKKLGVLVKKLNNNDIFISNKHNYKISQFVDGSILTLYDAPWPGLTPDLLSLIIVVATQAKGNILIHQKMFDGRLFFVNKLIDMGAKIILCDPHRVVVIGSGPKSLRASTMKSPDIRAGMSFLIAALCAQGVSFIHGVKQIDRGYEFIDNKLKLLGANIKRI